MGRLPRLAHDEGHDDHRILQKNMKSKGYSASKYDRGPVGNTCAVLGENPLLWLVLLNPPTEGGGIYFMGQGPEAQRGLSKKGLHRASGVHGDYGAVKPERGGPEGGVLPSASLLNDPFQSFVQTHSAHERIPLFTGHAALLDGARA